MMINTTTKIIFSIVSVLIISVAVFVFINHRNASPHKQTDYYARYATPTEASDALEKDPNDIKAHRELAEYYTMQRRYTDAAVQLTDIVNIDPSDRVDLLKLGFILAAEGHKEAAFKIFDQLAQGQDDNAAFAREYIRKYR